MIFLERNFDILMVVLLLQVMANVDIKLCSFKPRSMKLMCELCLLDTTMFSFFIFV